MSYATPSDIHSFSSWKLGDSFVSYQFYLSSSFTYDVLSLKKGAVLLNSEMQF